MATLERRTSELPLVSGLSAVDRILVLKAGVTSLATVTEVTAASFLGKTTDQLAEGTNNLYFTPSRVSQQILNTLVAGTNISFGYNLTTNQITINSTGNVFSVNNKTGAVSLNTDDIGEGSTNLYYTNERVDDRVATLLQAGSNVSLVYNDLLNTLTISSTGNVRSVNGQVGDITLNTDNINEGINNLYYTNTRVNQWLLTKTTTDLAEGTNQYFTQLRVRTTPLAGLTSGADAQIESLDTVLGAFGKVQTQITSAKNTANTHISRTDNPHNVTKAQVGLDNVPNVNTSNASNITSGVLPDARLSSNVTQQGNTFNGLNQLVKLDALGKLPAIDGSQLTGLISQIANLSDVQLIDLQVGQTLSYNGTKWVNTTSATATVRHDYSGVYSYVGRAPQLSPEASAVWKITRIQVLTDGNVLTTTANNVTWTGRLTHSYS
jgi:hypothetical protein